MKEYRFGAVVLGSLRSLRSHRPTRKNGALDDVLDIKTCEYRGELCRRWRHNWRKVFSSSKLYFRSNMNYDISVKVR